MITSKKLSAKVAARWVFGCLGGIILCAGCTSTGDPNDDSIFFNREKAERDRIAPLTAQLQSEQAGLADERGQTQQLEQQRAANEAHRERDREKIQLLQAKIAEKKSVLAGLNATLRETRERDETDARLIAERDAAQREVDRLTNVLKTLLEMQ